MARNDVTGDIISTGQAKGDKELYDSGWDRIFGKTKTEQPHLDIGHLAIYNTPKSNLKIGDIKSCGCLKSCGATREEYDSDCFGWNNCSYCDNGYYPCNQNCLVFG